MDFLIVKHQTNIPFYFQTNLFNVVNFMSTLYKYEVSKLSAIGKCQALTLQLVAIECDDWTHCSNVFVSQSYETRQPPRQWLLVLFRYSFFFLFFFSYFFSLFCSFLLHNSIWISNSLYLYLATRRDMPYLCIFWKPVET